MKPSQFKIPLLPFLMISGIIIYVIFQLITKFENLEKWQIMCFSIGGTLLLSMLFLAIYCSKYQRFCINITLLNLLSVMNILR